LYLGRLEYEKGVQDAIAALPRIRRTHPGTTLTIAGDGTQRDWLAEQARKHKVVKAVEFVGRLDHAELVQMLHTVDAAVLPSHYEPFGIVALEAAAAGTALAAASTGGLREIAADQRTAICFAPEDVAALAAAVSELLDDRMRAKRLVRAARGVLARDYSWPTVAARTAEVYGRAVREERALQARQAQRLRIVVRDGNLLTGESR
jgi:glycogen(starch) synthase